jgi:hypothetical protein
MKKASLLTFIFAMTFCQFTFANVDKIGGYRVIVTSGLDDVGLPVDEIGSIELDHKLFYVFSEWNLPAGDYRYSCIIYDGDRRIVNSQFNTYTSDGSNFSFWCSHYLDKSTDKPGDWYAEMGIDGYESEFIYFSVADDDIRKTLIGSWDFEGKDDTCKNEYVINISFNDAGTKMYHTSKLARKLTTSDTEYREVVYSILAEGDKYIRTLIINETQKNNKGETFLWDLIMKDDRSFCWKHSDWAEGHCTKRLIKCDT